MTGTCAVSGCFRDTACAFGYPDRSECEHWRAANEKAVEQSDEVDLKEAPVSDIPWNGYSLGTSDLAIIGSRGHPILIGLVGPPSSGKTSLLAFIYMWLLKHGSIGDWDFSGSWTLGGWESVVHHSRWTGEEAPSFPPHTSSSGRHPGLLHLTLRHRSSAVVRDVLFADAPGEWFTHWARVPDDRAAAGARWVVERASALLVLIDSGALANSETMPQTRRATRDLIERVGAEVGTIPVTVLWAKADLQIPQSVREALTRTCEQFLPGVAARETAVIRPESIEHCFSDVITVASNSQPPMVLPEPRLSHDPFLAFRGMHVRT